MSGNAKGENPAKQKVRICKLKKDGAIEEIEQLERSPIVFCSKCKAKADDPLSVCNPRALKAAKR